MEVAGQAAAVLIPVETVFGAGTFADVAQVVVLIQVGEQREPCLAGRRAVDLLVEPSVLDAEDHGIGEHGRRGGLLPGVRVVDDLAPHAVVGLVAQQRRHHQLVGGADSRQVGVVLGEHPQHLGHSDGHPPVAATPEVGGSGVVVEEPVGALDAVEVEHHLTRRAVDVLAVARNQIGLGLEVGDHEHVVDPESGLPRVALVGILLGFGELPVVLRVFGQDPLVVGVFHAQFEVAGIAVVLVDLQGHGAEDVEVDDVVRCGIEFRLEVLLGGEERFEALDQTGVERVVAGPGREPQGSEPGADVGIGDQRHLVFRVDVAPVGVRGLEIAFGQPDADLFGLAALGEVFQVPALLRLHGRSRGEQQQGLCDENELFHEVFGLFIRI